MSEPVDRRTKAIDDLTAQMIQAAGHGSPKVYRALAAAAILYGEKNKEYATSAEPFANFKESPPVTKGLLDPCQYAYTLMAKQDDALPRLIWSRAHVMAMDSATPAKLATPTEYEERGGHAMLCERLFDGIVYRAIIMALAGE